MKKILGIGSLIAFCTIVVLQPSFAEQADLQTRIQDTISRYEKIKADSVYFDISLGTGFDTKQAIETVNSLGKDVSSVIDEIDAVQKKKKNNDSNYTAVLEQVKKVVIDITETKKVVTDAVTKIQIANKDIVTTVGDLQDARKYIAASKSSLSQLVQLLYLIQNDYYGGGNIDDIKLLLKSDNISDTLSADDIMNTLTLQFDALIDDLTIQQDNYEKQFTRLTELRDEYKHTVIAYEDKMKTLQEQKAYLLDFLKLYKANRIEITAEMKNLFQTRAQLKAKLATLVSGVRDFKHNQALITTPGYQELLALKDDREKRKNFFLWPVLPVKVIDQYFSTGADSTGDAFLGTRIQAHQYDPIYAPANGMVYKVSDQDGMAINWIVLVHNDGYMSVFTNINQALVKEGDVVKRGEMIALVGGQQGTRGAGFQSQGEGLYLQLYKNGIPVDPLSEMDLSVIPDQTTLPSVYTVKRNLDKQMRDTPIKMSDVPFVDGETPEQRTRDFLKRYAAGPYAIYALWLAAAKDTNVDVDLGICIGLAETSLGRYFASANNIGNVGNNDRGDRVDQDSPLVGARSIFYTLNNSFLGGYHTIYELSGYGNKNGAIYASSPYNWQKNVTRCLSSIKGYIVPEDYPFRTYKSNN